MIGDESDVLTLKNIVVERTRYKLNCTTKAEYLKPHMRAFKEQLEQGASQQELYLTKRGNLDRVPNILYKLFCHPSHQPWKHKNTDKGYLATEELLKLQDKGKILDSCFIPSFCISTAKKSEQKEIERMVR